ncbi:MAG TPA: hypothetical protein VHI98_17125 [Vicinamibacterales bacterium]|nr:hypothetical protein [Vicinamibacterales bacterium]
MTRLRQALGELRAIEDAPAQLIEGESKDDGESIVVLNCLFLWDCWILSESGEYAVFLCHDEWGEVYATSASTLRDLTEALKKMDVLSDHT